MIHDDKIERKDFAYRLTILSITAQILLTRVGFLHSNRNVFPCLENDYEK